MTAIKSMGCNQGDLALVTGATGFVGRHLVRQLVNRGCRVRVLSRQAYSDARLPGIDKDQWLTGELSDSSVLDRATQDVDAVLHLANIAHVRTPDAQALRVVNIEGTRALHAASLRAGVKSLVYVSSALAASPDSSAYANSKHEAEQLLMTAAAESESLHVTALRPVNVYGVGMKGNIAGLIRRIQAGSMPPLPLLENRLALVSVDDLCQAILLASAARHKSGQVLTVTDGQVYTPSRIEDAIYVACKCKKPDWRTPRVVFYAAAAGAQLANSLGIWRNDLGLPTYRNLVADNPVFCEKISAELGFKPTQSLESVIDQIIDQNTDRNTEKNTDASNAP